MTSQIASWDDSAYRQLEDRVRKPHEQQQQPSDLATSFAVWLCLLAIFLVCVAWAWTTTGVTQ